MAQFDSPVVIDFVLAKNEVKPTPASFYLAQLGDRSKIEPGPRHQLSLVKGDVKEVGARTKAIHGSDVDTIHNDIYFDFELAQTHVSKLGPSRAKFVDHEELQQSHEEDYAIFNNFVWGFVLREGVWAKLDLNCLREMDTSQGLMDDLQLPEEHMNILKATVQPRAQTSVASQLSLDLVQGKGRGVKIMLYGDPGVGKTCTAEAIADYTNRPLYRITVGTLGTDVADIEKNLRKVFKRGHKWGCIVLFDEADVFFLSRDKGDPYRNQIVSIFLNNLEHYSGILILTTNRAEAFDEAIMSRIPIVLYYPPLGLDATLKLFEQHFKRLSQVGGVPQGSNYYGHSVVSADLEVEIDEKAIEKWVEAAFKKAKNGWWNGRQIQYGFRNAVALAEAARRPYEKKIKLTVKEFEQIDRINSANQERQRLFGQPQRSMKDKLSSQGTDNDDSEDYEEAAAPVKRK